LFFHCQTPSDPRVLAPLSVWLSLKAPLFVLSSTLVSNCRTRVIFFLLRQDVALRQLMSPFRSPGQSLFFHRRRLFHPEWCPRQPVVFVFLSLLFHVPFSVRSFFVIPTPFASPWTSPHRFPVGPSSIRVQCPSLPPCLILFVFSLRLLIFCTLRIACPAPFMCEVPLSRLSFDFFFRAIAPLKDFFFAVSLTYFYCRPLFARPTPQCRPSRLCRFVDVLELPVFESWVQWTLGVVVWSGWPCLRSEPPLWPLRVSSALEVRTLSLFNCPVLVRAS